MATNLHPEVAHGQQPWRACCSTTMHPMVVGDQQIRDAFSRRLESALEKSPRVPPDPRRWRSWMARRYGVSQESARKWLSGLSLPETTKLVAIATDLGVSVNHLLTGTDDERTDPTAAALPDDEQALLDAWRGAHPRAQEAAKGVMALLPAHTLQVAEPRPGAPELDVALLQLVLREANTLPGIDADGVAEVAAQVYAALAASGQKPTRAAVIRLLRTA